MQVEHFINKNKAVPKNKTENESPRGRLSYVLRVGQDHEISLHEMRTMCMDRGFLQPNVERHWWMSGGFFVLDQYLLMMFLVKARRSGDG